MNILHIAYIRGNRAAGPTKNVLQNVIYGERNNNVALLNIHENKLNGLISEKLIFNYKDYNSIEKLPSPFNNPDIVVFSGIYYLEYVKLCKNLIRRNIPYVIVPRGSLTYGAQEKKKIKKFLGNTFFLNNFVKKASSINFLTKNEFIESKKFKFKSYYINGNGIEMPHQLKDFTQKINDKFVVTFIGRIEWFHKGLDYLVESINLGKEEFRNKKFEFNLYGPDNWNSIEKLQKMIDTYKINDLININGPVYDNEKEKILLNSDLFIHTSRLEGQPTAVMEAVSFGIPILVTPRTNVVDIVKENNLGFVADENIESIKNELLNAYENRINFAQICKNEINYAIKELQWDNVIEKNVEEYKKIIKEVRLEK